jgi:hypothetical protein
MRSDRLNVLADYLEKVVAKLPPSRWDMYSWGLSQECGTAYCALGWATFVPEFAAAGLRLVWDDEGSAAVKFGIGNNQDSMSSGAQFFEIDPKTASRLFNADKDYRTIEHVVARLRAVANETPLEGSAVAQQLTGGSS